jgi:Fungal specific transcription factor domain
VLDIRVSFQPVRTLSFKVALAGPAAFHIIIAAAARNIASLHGRHDSRQSVTYHGLVLRLVNKQISQSLSVPSDATIATAAMLAGNEVGFPYIS